MELKIDLKIEVEHFTECNVGAKVNIKKVTKIGTKVCTIKYENPTEKNNAMKNKKKLKELQERICINNEVTKEERNIQYKLKQIVESERSEGRNVKI